VKRLAGTAPPIRVLLRCAGTVAGRPRFTHNFPTRFVCSSPPLLLLQVGDKVLLPEYGGHQVKLGEDEFHLYREEDILGKFDLK